MGVISAAKEALGKFLEGSGKKLRLDVETTVTNTRTDSPNNIKKVTFKKRQPNKQRIIDSEVDQSTHNSGIQAETINIESLVLQITPNALQSGGLTTQDLPPELQVLSQAFQNKQIAFVTEDEQKTLTDALDFEKQTAIASQLRFFKDRLTPRYYNLMRTGFFIRHLNQTAPTRVGAEWQKIQSNTDRSERRVINLASAGYFETYFRPLAKTYETEGYTFEDFKEAFDSIVHDPHFVVFVSAEATPGSVINEVETKARKNIKFRVIDDIIYIHAMGAVSIATTQTAVEDLRKTFTRIEKMKHSKYTQENSIRYRVFYRETVEQDFYH